jgi:membrane-bound lytic murein transglycosylase D
MRWNVRQALTTSGIIAAGALVAVGSLERTSFLPKPAVVEHPVASILAAQVAKPFDPSKLDNGTEHVRIDFWVDRIKGATSSFATTLSRMSKYSDMITAKLDKRDMPRDLIYLAAIESEFNPNARSRVKAVGMWQFMKGTAKQFGLAVHGKTDERKNPAKATDAALDYLSDLHDQFGSWYLAAAAYNSGPGTVRKALRTVTGKTTGTDEDFFKILHALPKETQDYVPKLIASARVGNEMLAAR